MTYNRKQYERRRARINTYKDVPCSDCEIKFPTYAMDFDHRNPDTKLFRISAAVNRSKESVKAEIAKCDIVCANCHRIRTHKRRISM